MQNKRGLIEWMLMFLPVAILGGTVLITYGRMDERFAAKCTTFQEAITRMEHGGTEVSVTNREKIAVLQTKIDNIDRQVTEMNANQKEMLRLLRNARPITPP